MKSTKVKMSMVPRGSAQDLPAGHLDPMGMGMGLRDLRDDLSIINNSRSDWKETAEAHVLTAQVLGLTREELRVEVEEDRVFQVSGERCVERVETTDNCRRVERCSGKFVRRFKLPDDADAEQIKSSLERGVLTITVPNMQPRQHDA